MKLRIAESNYLFEDIDAVKKYYPNIDDSTFMDLIALDPTYRNNNSLGKYGKWILNLYNKGEISEDDFSEIPALLNQFTTYRNRVQNKDLNSYKSISDLESVLAQVVDDDSMLTPRQKVRFLKNVKSGKISLDASDDYDIVLETPKFVVYVPNTHEASMKLGKGTKWCTAHENPDWYNSYTANSGKLYIVKDKQTGDRWQYSDKKEDFLDQNDSPFDIQALMKTDEKLSKFFENFLGIDFYSFDGTWVYDGKPVPKNLQNSVTSVIIPDGYDRICPYAFESCWEVKKVVIPNSVKSIGDYAFKYCQNLEYIEIPDGVTIIDDGAFYDCYCLSNIKIPDSVESIGELAFGGCECIESIVIPKGVNSIYNYTFSGCYALKHITIPDSVHSISGCAFQGCTSLKSLIIPDSVTMIENYAFDGCDNLTVYTDSLYVRNVCLEDDISVKPVKEFKNESVRRKIKLKISETDKRGRIYR